MHGNIKIYFFSLLTMFLVADTVLAQDAIGMKKKKNTVETNHFADDCFMSVGLGTQMYFGDHNRQMNIGQLLTPALDMAVGKWFTPEVGARFMYSGLSAKGATQNLSHSTGVVYDADKLLYKQKFNLSNFHVDVLFNFSNLLFGYDENRLYSACPYVGLGWMVTWDTPRAHKLNANLGVLNTYKLSHCLDLNLDIRSAVVNDGMDGEKGGYKGEGTFSVTLGISYKLGGKKNRAVILTEPMSEVELKLMSERLQSMEMKHYK